MPAATLSLVVIVGSALLMIGLERRFPYRPEQKLLRPGFWLDLLWYTLVQSYLLGLVITVLITVLDDTTGWSSHGLISSWPVWCQVLFFFVTHDLYIYLFHRWQHASRWLWRIHEAHHSTRDVDWLSGSRSHPLEILINQTIEFAPIVLLGAAPEVALIKATVDAVWGMYIHSNIAVRSGALQWIVNGPEMHRWHHSPDVAEPGKNFATKLALWDWIFGTAYLPVSRAQRAGLFPEDDRRFPHDGTLSSAGARRELGVAAFWVRKLLDPLAAYVRQIVYAFRIEQKRTAEQSYTAVLEADGQFQPARARTRAASDAASRP